MAPYRFSQREWRDPELRKAVVASLPPGTRLLPPEGADPERRAPPPGYGIPKSDQRRSIEALHALRQKMGLPPLVSEQAIKAWDRGEWSDSTYARWQPKSPDQMPKGYIDLSPYAYERAAREQLEEASAQEAVAQPLRNAAAAVAEVGPPRPDYGMHLGSTAPATGPGAYLRRLEEGESFSPGVSLEQLQTQFSASSHQRMKTAHDYLRVLRDTGSLTPTKWGVLEEVAVQTPGFAEALNLAVPSQAKAAAISAGTQVAQQAAPTPRVIVPPAAAAVGQQRMAGDVIRQYAAPVRRYEAKGKGGELEVIRDFMMNGILGGSDAVDLSSERFARKAINTYDDLRLAVDGSGLNYHPRSLIGPELSPFDRSKAAWNNAPFPDEIKKAVLDLAYGNAMGNNRARDTSNRFAGEKNLETIQGLGKLTEWVKNNEEWWNIFRTPEISEKYLFKGDQMSWPSGVLERGRTTSNQFLYRGDVAPADTMRHITPGSSIKMYGSQHPTDTYMSFGGDPFQAWRYTRRSDNKAKAQSDANSLGQNEIVRRIFAYEAEPWVALPKIENVGQTGRAHVVVNPADRKVKDVYRMKDELDGTPLYLIKI